MIVINWLTDNYIEVFGAVTGILYVFLEIRQNLWLWPVGIITSAVYIWVFLTGKLYADMSLQGYYLIISVLGWYWWVTGLRQKAPDSYREGKRQKEEEKGRMGEGEIAQLDSPFEGPVPTVALVGQGDHLSDSPFEGGQGDVFTSSVHTNLVVTRLKVRIGIILSVVFAFLYAGMWFLLDRLTDSPVPGWDSFITSLSIVATWMLARKIIEHWYLWMIVNAVAMVLFLSRGLYPTAVLYAVYFTMSFIGLNEWSKTVTSE
jgi:nicotinamide mononucleotide transporter